MFYQCKEFSTVLFLSEIMTDDKLVKGKKDEPNAEVCGTDDSYTGK